MKYLIEDNAGFFGFLVVFIILAWLCIQLGIDPTPALDAIETFIMTAIGG